MEPKFKAGDRVDAFDGPLPGVVAKTRGTDGRVVLDTPHTAIGHTWERVSYGHSPSHGGFWSVLGPLRFEHEPARPTPPHVVRAKEMRAKALVRAAGRPN